jgi:5-deoxy-glucuronate isomerase
MKKNHIRVEALEEGINSIINEETSPLEFIRSDLIRILGGQEIEYAAQDTEYALELLQGRARVTIGSRCFELEALDAVYVTRGDAFSISKDGDGEALLLLGCAPAVNRYESVLIKYDQVKPFKAGDGPDERDVRRLISSDSVQADRLILGHCRGGDGGWTGWLPHEHGETKEELYYFFGMQEDGYVLQLHYTNLDGDLRAYAVKNGDFFAIKSGYHPIVATPGTAVQNIWIMAAIRPVVDRD